MAANETPSWAKVIKDAIAADRSELHTAMPATVETYDAATGMVSVSPCLKRRYANGDLVDLPIIPNVPVLFPRGGNAAITFDLQKGDSVLLVFAERSVDTWKTTGGKVDPKDTRKHALSDAFAIPGGYPKTSPVAAALIKAAFTATGAVTIENPAGLINLANTGAFTVQNGSGLFKVDDFGKIKFENNLGVELFAQLLAVIDLMMQSQVATMLGLQPFIPPPTYAAERLKLDAFPG